MRDFRNIKVWEKAHTLTLAVYRVTACYPKDELYGLVSQTRRASASIPANIAEGSGSNTDPEFGRYLQIAMKSASELEYHLILAHDLGYLSADDYPYLNDMVIEVKRMLAPFIQKLVK